MPKFELLPPESYMRYAGGHLFIPLCKREARSPILLRHRRAFLRKATVAGVEGTGIGVSERVRRWPRLELLLLGEKHAEADDGSVNQQATNYGHDHRLDLDETGMREDDREGHSHDDKEAGKEATKVEDGSARALNEVIGVGAVAADPVGYRGEHIGGDDEERVIDLPQGAGEDDEEEAHGEDKGEGDDGLEPGGRHGGRFAGARSRVRDAMVGGDG